MTILNDVLAALRAHEFTTSIELKFGLMNGPVDVCDGETVEARSSLLPRGTPLTVEGITAVFIADVQADLNTIADKHPEYVRYGLYLYQVPLVYPDANMVRYGKVTA